MATPQTQMLRAFIAINLDPALLAELEKLQRRLRFGDAVRWTKPEQIHLTLKFLGDIAPETVPQADAALKRACQGVQPFELSLEGLGCFPGENKPSVVWVGVGGGVEALKALQGRVEQETRSLASHSEDREFRPHLTIARVRSSNFSELRRIGGMITTTAVARLGAWTVKDVHLMQSELLREGARHTDLATIPLAP
ncbi:MAG: RNA 2',3'-cyclic phosphodiesterase [Planctomycetota bacterium]|nr:RNA 2',3'-cyclic phosphodiesterase [Planctomycetota bacterium]